MEKIKEEMTTGPEVSGTDSNDPSTPKAPLLGGVPEKKKKKPLKEILRRKLPN